MLALLKIVIDAAAQAQGESADESVGWRIGLVMGGELGDGRDPRAVAACSNQRGRAIECHYSAEFDPAA